MAKDPFIPFAELEDYLNNLNKLLSENNLKDKNLIEKLITSYNSKSKIVDHIYIEKMEKNIKLKEFFLIFNNNF